jgi:hypothetical protein
MTVLHAPDNVQGAVATGDPDLAVSALTSWATWLENRAATPSANEEAGAARSAPKARGVPDGDLGSFRGKHLHPRSAGNSRHLRRVPQQEHPLAGARCREGRGELTARFRMRRWN